MNRVSTVGNPSIPLIESFQSKRKFPPRKGFVARTSSFEEDDGICERFNNGAPFSPIINVSSIPQHCSNHLLHLRLISIGQALFAVLNFQVVLGMAMTAKLDIVHSLIRVTLLSPLYFIANFVIWIHNCHMMICTGLRRGHRPISTKSVFRTGYLATRWKSRSSGV